MTTAKAAYIPDIALFARHSYQNGVPFLVHNFGSFGINVGCDVFDFGNRRATVREREAGMAQAQENLQRLKEAVSVQIERSYNKVERTKQMVQVAGEVVVLRQESERISGDQLAQASYKALADLLEAQLAYMLARAELEQTAGRTPGL